MAATQTISRVYPLGSTLSDRGRLEVGGCDVIELAERFGTPAYIVAEDDLRARAQAFVAAFKAAGQADFEVLFASKAFPATAVMRLFAQQGLGCDVASAGELHLALRGGFDESKLVLHGNARDDGELAMALDAHVGLIVIDSFDDIDRLERLVAGRAERQPVLLRVTPGVRGDTHDKISTGQADSKFGLGLGDARAAIARVARIGGLDLRGLHFHIGSHLLSVEPFREAIAAIAGLGDFPVYDIGGGLGVAYTAGEESPAIDEWVGGIVVAARELLGPGKRLMIEPGRALVASGVVTLYRVIGVKHNVSTWVAVDGGMSDNLRPMLYGARYEADVADRLGGSDRVQLVGKHCESGDVIVPDALLDDPRVGDVVVVPVTGAYCYAMANNYNGVPRPPVIFAKDGEAHLVVRRETLDDLHARDV
ncbi:MAG: diaminopimelate decarboxylase [Solirubrobacteraceae bacterium]|jgi:diaminopimelate decarboxylase